jgi:uncharacterized membrane protein
MKRALWSDEKLEILVGKLLQVGVLCSAAVVLLGAIIYLFRHGSSPMSLGAFHGEPADLRTIRGILRGVRTGRSRAIIQLGLLLLIATPIARVALSIFGFARERDHLYVALTSIVFVILLYSLLVSV